MRLVVSFGIPPVRGVEAPLATVERRFAASLSEAASPVELPVAPASFLSVASVVEV